MPRSRASSSPSERSSRSRVHLPPSAQPSAQPCHQQEQTLFKHRPSAVVAAVSPSSPPCHHRRPALIPRSHICPDHTSLSVQSARVQSQVQSDHTSLLMQSGGSPAVSTATHQASLSLVRPCSIVASPLPSTDLSLASLDRCGRARLPPLRPSQTSLSASFCCTLQPPDAVWSPNAVQTTRTAHSPSNIMTRHSQPPSAAALQHLLMP